MCTVTIFMTDTNESIDERDFELEQWVEIGKWLDHYGYRNPAYYVRLRFS